MIEMREWWSNVYIFGGEARMGNAWGIGAHAYLPHADAPSRFRIHVRLKPEGAPKRYASAANRRAWEELPDVARQIVRAGHAPESVW